MEIIFALLIGVLFGTGIYFLLRRSLVKLILGIIFFSNSINLLLFVSAGVKIKDPPFLEQVKSGEVADPLPQALILTAIVIGFGIIAFTLVLKFKFHEATGTEDMDKATKEVEE